MEGIGHSVLTFSNRTRSASSNGYVQAIAIGIMQQADRSPDRGDEGGQAEAKQRLVWLNGNVRTGQRSNHYRTLFKALCGANSSREAEIIPSNHSKGRHLCHHSIAMATSYRSQPPSIYPCVSFRLNPPSLTGGK